MNNNLQKKVLAIHDISCVGRCSLTVALPILSAAGINTGILPTALLSTHTGGFTGYTMKDLSNEMLPIATHLSKVALPFDAIYTGYLANADQIDIVLATISLLKQKNTLLLIDPAFADNGNLYPLITKEMVRKMHLLINQADIIVPNLTECSFLLDCEFKNLLFSDEEILDIARALSKMGPNNIVITSIPYRDNKLGTVVYNKNTDKIYNTFFNKQPGIFYGTGDVFASVLLACIMRGHSIEAACATATEFTFRCIKQTTSGGEDYKFGVRFELELPWLIKRLQS